MRSLAHLMLLQAALGEPGPGIRISLPRGPTPAEQQLREDYIARTGLDPDEERELRALERRKRRRARRLARRR